MDRSKGIAYCGLACCACSENSTCAGCRNDGCSDKTWCRPFNCCPSKGLAGCWECGDFPCDDPLFSKVKVVAFAKLAASYGVERLMDSLEENEQQGLSYHFAKQLVGDYDFCSTEAEIVKLLRKEP